MVKKARRTRNALPVFSVDSASEARDLQVRLCRLSYDGRDYRLPNPRQDGALMELDDLDAVTAVLRSEYAQQKEIAR